jgi:cytosine/adenosine deaminase-related metal-dependent hydrolase
VILRARIIVPVTHRTIADGAVELFRGRIRRVGAWREFSAAEKSRALDLGDVALLPGLINAHCHLEYTGMAGEFLPPKKFSDWLKLIVAAKGVRDDDEFADAWRLGAQQLLRTGTTTVADIAALPALLPATWDTTPLRVISFLEMTGVKSKRPPRKILGDALKKISKLRHARSHAALSPHSPYATTPALLRLTAEAARRKKIRVTTHVAESAEELEMFTHASGKMFDWLKRQRDMSDCGHGSPVQALAAAGLLGANFLAVHANCLAPGDAALLARKKSSVVHCPRSHSFFGHPKFPFKQLAAAGVNICLGTDSLASVEAKRKTLPELNMFSEMRSFARRNASVPPGTVLQLATANAACALGLRGRAGEISKGAFADLIALPCREKLADVHEAILHHRGAVAASLIGGKWAIAPNA